MLSFTRISAVFTLQLCALALIAAKKCSLKCQTGVCFEGHFNSLTSIPHHRSLVNRKYVQNHHYGFFRRLLRPLQLGPLLVHPYAHVI